MSLSELQRKQDVVGDVPIPSRFMMPGIARKLDRKDMVSRYQAAIRGCRVPREQQLVAITSYYNPVGYFNREYNYWEFALSLARHGIQLVTGEVVNDMRKQAIPDSIPLKSSAVMWHKERSLNVVENLLPQSCEYVAWIDCDLVWSRPWHNRALEMLREKPVIQLFDRIVFLNEECKRSDELPRYGFARAFEETRPWYPSSNHPPGGAWAAHRMLFRKFGGLYDRLVSGGADCFCSGAFINAGMHNPVLGQCNQDIVDDYTEYADGVGQYVRADIGYTDDIVFHLWHGSRENKQYRQRMDYMLDFDPKKDLRVADSGLYEWSGKNRSADFKKYFSDRKEDTP